MSFFKNFKDFRNSVLVVFVLLIVFSLLFALLNPVSFQYYQGSVELVLIIAGFVLLTAFLPSLLGKRGFYVLDFKTSFGIVSKTAFQIILVFFLLLLLAAEFFPIFKQFDLLVVLAIVVVLGVISIVLNPTDVKESVKPPSKIDFFLVGFFSILGAFLVFAKTSSLGSISIILSIISGVLIFLCSILLLEEDFKNPERNL